MSNPEIEAINYGKTCRTAKLVAQTEPSFNDIPDPICKKKFLNLSRSQGWRGGLKILLRVLSGDRWAWWWKRLCLASFAGWHGAETLQMQTCLFFDLWWMGTQSHNDFERRQTIWIVEYVPGQVCWTPVWACSYGVRFTAWGFGL